MKASRWLVAIAVAVVLIAVAVVLLAQRRTATDTASPPPGPAVAALKAVHSPGKVAQDQTLRPGQCRLRTINARLGQYLPDPACTPGSVDPAVTQANIGSTICRPGYTKQVRPPAADTGRFKAAGLKDYGLRMSPSTEFDHLVSLELGGANAVSNLWPEPNRKGASGTANPKDAVEDRLKAAVCARQVPLAAAQEAIARNWVTALYDVGLEPEPRFSGGG
jgi:hypothetical protein